MRHRTLASALVLTLGTLLPGLVDAQGTLTVTNSAFREGQPIPQQYSAYGAGLTPPLSWSGAPQGTRSFALILGDPDAPVPQPPFIHWVIYNIPATATGLPEGLPTDASLSAPPAVAGATQGNMGMGRSGYFGPRPPAGPPHRYIFTVYALDVAGLAPGMTAAALTEAMQGHILAQGQLTGTYQQQ